MDQHFADAPYRDTAVPTDERVSDLLSRMTVEEKAGLMFHQMLFIGPGGDLAGAIPAADKVSTQDMVTGQLINHFNVMGGEEPSVMAAWHNRVQNLARSTRLGIPVTLSTDPRHAFTDNPGASFSSGYFSSWPETLGLAAISDESVTEKFGDIARQEYLAVGLRVGLHPQIDLATEPRWSRINGTFGEDADLTSRMAVAYVRGFQGERLGPQSVSTMVKHFPGGGPQKDGEDPHFSYGREQVYPGNNFDYHLKPFEAVFAAGITQIMPYYGMPVGTEHEEVGFAFNKSVITDLLRTRFGFDGIVCADWGLLTDAKIMGETHVHRAWGLEHLSREELILKALEAGVDQFGGESCPEVIVDLIRDGRLSEARIDISASRLLREKFILGLFDNPFVDPAAAPHHVARPEFIAAGEDAQRASFTVLTNQPLNQAETGRPALPVAAGSKLFLRGVDSTVAADYGTVVDRPEDADIAIIRIKAPYQPRPGQTRFEDFFHAGSLAYDPDTLNDILQLCAQVPTVVDIYLDRPAVIPEIAGAAAALLADYGASDQALLDVVFGGAAPRGRLPFDLPSSMAAVQNSHPDVPFDTDHPLFRFGHGLTV